MRLQQVVRPELQVQPSCDYGVELRRSTGISLDFRLHDDGRIYPVLTLKHGNARFIIQYKEGFVAEQIRSSSETVTAALRNASLELLQEDPTCSDVFVAVRCSGGRVEESFMTTELYPFFKFVFENGYSRRLRPKVPPKN